MRKNNFLTLAFILLIGIFVSCDKENIDEQDLPGNIPGMGNAGGELEVIEAFEMPEGLSFDGEITGYDASQIIVDKGNVTSQNSVKSLSIQIAGSGGEYIAILVGINNNTDQPIPYVIKKGTVFACSEDGYQNGICVKEIVFYIPANSRLQLIVQLYCANAGAEGSDSNVTYKQRGVTSSLNMMEIIDALKSKQVNIDEFQDLTKYYLWRTKIQAIIWSCTNGGGVSSESWDFIDSLPERI
ncbi:hypothetical protein [Labilibaculum antarcticum]|uniref:Uncharacterized protein n=1 Tax=Labilibaculum antarcticum TaxID=1717717 RepID=A0A1Y1CRJ2_9BACT|nr:hypothetical protein [Labilibaculum antarcticum]BAX82613.1 hypothetical protein ALGA_4323 [Labilibaculum antarcticum]